MKPAANQNDFIPANDNIRVKIERDRAIISAFGKTKEFLSIMEAELFVWSYYAFMEGKNGTRGLFHA